MGIPAKVISEHLGHCDTRTTENIYAHVFAETLAQEESRSISENVTWGQRKRMADGKVSFAYSRFLGLDKDKETGKIVVNPEQAKTVRLMLSNEKYKSDALLQ